METFLKASSQPTAAYSGLPVLDLVGVTATTGNIGLEIEVEGNKFPKYGTGQYSNYTNVQSDYLPAEWSFHHDGSLRGDDNAEYVLKRPLEFDKVPGAVSKLWDMFDGYGTLLDDSNRTSVHVHLNVQSFHLNRLCSFVGMYFAVEDLLTQWCGDHRVGNLFCLRAKDARGIVSSFKTFLKSEGQSILSSGLHYSGLNLGALSKFGSLEIRTMRGVSDPKIILDWVAILRRLYDLSGEFTDPRDVVSGFSGGGPLAWLENILGDQYATVVNGVPYDTDQIRNSLYEGIRIAQDVCYCRDWSVYVPRTVARDPFGRKSKTIGTATGLSALLHSPPSSGYTSTSSAQGCIANATYYINNGQLSAPVDEPEEDNDAFWEDPEDQDYDEDEE